MILPTIANAPASASASALTPGGVGPANAAEVPEGAGFTAALAHAQHQAHGSRAAHAGRHATHGNARDEHQAHPPSARGTDTSGNKPVEKTTAAKDEPATPDAPPSLFDLSATLTSAPVAAAPATVPPEGPQAAEEKGTRPVGVRARFTGVDNARKDPPPVGERSDAPEADDREGAQPVEATPLHAEKDDAPHGKVAAETPRIADSGARASAFQSALNAAGAPLHAASESTHKPASESMAPAGASSAPAAIALPVAVDHSGAVAPAPAPASPPFEGRVSAPLSSPDFVPALGVQLTLLAREGVHEARLHLNPAEMGPIAVQIAVDGSQAVVHFQAEQAATRQVLENSLPDLAAALRDGGLTLSGGSVSQQPQQRGAGDPGSESERWSGRVESTRGTGPSDPSLDHLASLPAATVVRRQGVVDFYA
jgi:hypothetical protein